MSTAKPAGICEDFPVMIADVKIPRKFVILEMFEGEFIHDSLKDIRKYYMGC